MIISPGETRDKSFSLLITLAFPVIAVSPIDIPRAITSLTKPTLIKSVEPLTPLMFLLFVRLNLPA